MHGTTYHQPHFPYPLPLHGVYLNFGQIKKHIKTKFYVIRKASMEQYYLGLKEACLQYDFFNRYCAFCHFYVYYFFIEYKLCFISQSRLAANTHK